MIQAIFDANADTADFFFLVALIVFIIAGVMCAMAKDIMRVLVCAGLASLTLAFLFLT